MTSILLLLLAADSVGTQRVKVVDSDPSHVAPVSTATPAATDPGLNTRVVSEPPTSGLTNQQLRAAPVQVQGSSFGPPLRVDGSGTTQPVSISGTVTTSGSLTDAQLRATPVPVSGTVTASGPLTDTQLRATAVPISATSLPLPTGAASLAKQPALGTAGSAAADVISVQGIAGGTALPVSGSVTVSGTFYQTTQPVSEVSLPIPAGAATQAGQPRFGVAGRPAPDVLTVQGAPFAAPLPVSVVGGPIAPTGNGTSTGAGRVVIASDNSPMIVADTGLDSSTGLPRPIATSSAGVVYVIQLSPPLNPFLPRCNPVLRVNCQP